MKPKIRVYLLVFILSLVLNPFGLIGDPDDSSPTAKSEMGIEVLPVPHPFYDSQVLSGALKMNEIEKDKILIVLKTLTKYSTNEELKKEIYAQTELSETFVEGLQGKLDEFKTPFLENYITALERSLGIYLVSLQRHAGGVAKLYAQAEITSMKAAPPQVAKTGLVSPTMLVDALSSFIAKRFKEELALAFLDKFKLKLEEVRENGWGVLFPSTITFLTGTEIYNFKVFLASLKDVFRDDLNNIDSNLVKYLKKIRDPNRGNSTDTKNAATIIEIVKDEKLVNFSIFILELVHSVRSGEHPAEIINNLNKADSLGLIDGKFANPIRLLAMVSRTLGNIEGNGWIKPAEFKVLLYDSSGQLRKLFIGLIYAREKDEMDKITFGEKSLEDILEKNENKIISVNEYMGRFTVIAEDIQEQIKKLKANEKIGIEEFNIYLETVYELADLGFDIKEFAGYDRNDEDIKKYLGCAKNLLAITQNIIERDYSLALVNTVSVLEKILPPGSAAGKEILKYGTFMISMINAETAGDMEKILEDAAMPVGGYRVVRSSPFSVSLSAYPGVFGSREIVTANMQIKGEKAEWNASFAAPIGVVFGLGRGSFDKPGPSWSLFFPIIDIGAVVSWRLGGEDKGIPDLSWKNIIAPGAFIMYGIKNTPLSIGAGIQYGPQLREIKLATDAVIESSAFRVGVLIAVEIPIFNFYAKGK